MYEGTFHSCALDGDYSITLKTARRLPSESNNKSGEVIDMLVISGKDFLQVSAFNVPPPGEEGRKAFLTDAEISRKDVESSRDLVPWQGDGYGPDFGGLEDGAHEGKWDQFAENEQRYGVATTFNEEYYTTPLDKSAIPAEKRDKADQIAREIEAGNTYSEVEARVDEDGDGDEEARFSAAQPLNTGGGKQAMKPLPQVPERPGQELAASQAGTGRKGMISEMKRINALNLEPTSAKHDDTNVRGRTVKDQGARNPQRLTGTNQDLKSEFQQSLQVISQQEAKRNRGKNSEGEWDGTASQGDQKANTTGAMAKAGGDPSRTPSGQFSFNPKAKAFSLNPAAGEFMPGGGNAPANPGPAGPPAKASGPSPTLKLDKKGSKQQLKGLSEILEMFFQRAKNSNPDSAAPDWPDRNGPSYKDVLGHPNPNANTRVGQTMGHANMPQMQGGNWQQQQNQGQQQQPGQQTGQQVPQQQQQQQQQQVPQQNAPQNQEQQGGPQMVQGGMAMQPTMMPQAVFVGNPPGQGGQANQMQYGQMYPGGPGQGPAHQGQNVQPTIVFNNGAMMAQGGGNTMVPMPMQNQQGQMQGVTAGPAMAKFPGQQQQMVVVPMMALANTGQYGNGQAGFMAMQGQQMPPQQGGPGGPPQGDGQNQMMQQGMGYRQQ